MAKPTPEVLAKRKAKAKRSTMTNRIRVALANGNEKEGYRLASLLGEDIFLSRLPKEYQSPAEPWFVAKEAEMKALEEDKLTNWIEDPESEPYPFEEKIKAPSGANSIFSPEVQAVVEAKVEVPDSTPIDTESQITVQAFEPNPQEFAAAVQEAITPKPEEVPICVRGWPVSVIGAEVWGTCRNPNLMVALLPDNRKVSMYQGRFRKFQLRTKVDLTLEQDFLDGIKQADPIYIASEKRTNIW